MSFRSSRIWQKISQNQFLIGSALVFLVILVGRIIQFIKELFVAKEIGIVAELDAFIMALLIISMSSEFLIKPFGYALIPIIVRLKKYSVEKMNLLFTKVLFISLVLAAGISIIQISCIDYMLSFFAAGFGEEHQIFTREIFIWLIPYFIFDILGFLFGVYLNAQNKNLLYSIYPAFPALFTILYFLFIPVDQPIYNQVYGFSAGSFIVLCLLIYTCYRHGFRPRINLKLDKSLKICIQQWLPLILSALLISVNPMVDKKMASDLGVGNLSHLEYGVKVFSIFSGFAVTVISTVLYPYYSQKVADKDFKGIQTFFKTTMKVALPPLIIGTSFIIFYSEEIIRLLFERGAFLPKDTVIVASLMNFYMISFPILTIGIIGVRFINAIQLNQYVLIFSLVNLILNVLLNFVFIEYYGLKGIALSTSLVYTVNAILMWITISWYFKKNRHA